MHGPGYSGTGTEQICRHPRSLLQQLPIVASRSRVLSLVYVAMTRPCAPAMYRSPHNWFVNSTNIQLKNYITSTSYAINRSISNTLLPHKSVADQTVPISDALACS
eukprot:COSAG02_NODE_430_length_22462_cov_52.755042_11_plen_106_part_00